MIEHVWLATCQQQGCAWVDWADYTDQAEELLDQHMKDEHS